MEMTLDMNGLDQACKCDSGKLAGNCCRKDETCPCGSGKKVCECCMKDTHNADTTDSTENK